MVGQSGLEPPTSRLSVVCSNQLSYWPIGGDERNRTADPLLAKQVLSQLSYTPAFSRFGFRCPLCFEDLRDEPAGPSKLNNTETCFPVQCHLDQLNHTV